MFGKTTGIEKPSILRYACLRAPPTFDDWKMSFFPTSAQSPLRFTPGVLSRIPLWITLLTQSPHQYVFLYLGVLQLMVLAACVVQEARTDTP